MEIAEFVTEFTSFRNVSHFYSDFLNQSHTLTQFGYNKIENIRKSEMLLRKSE